MIKIKIKERNSISNKLFTTIFANLKLINLLLFDIYFYLLIKMIINYS